MRISIVAIQNFSGFQSELIELDVINVFVGENDTGKVLFKNNQIRNRNSKLE